MSLFEQKGAFVGKLLEKLRQAWSISERRNQRIFLIWLLTSVLVSALIRPSYDLPNDLPGVGRVVLKTYRAPRTFSHEIENQEGSRANQEAAESAVNPVYAYNPELYEQLTESLRHAFAAARELQAQEQDLYVLLSNPEAKTHFSETLGVATLAPEQLSILSANRFSVRMENIVVRMLIEALAGKMVTQKEPLLADSDQKISLLNLTTRDESIVGVNRLGAVRDVAEVVTELAADYRQRNLGVSTRTRDCLLQLAQQMISPNLTQEMEETVRRRQRAREGAPKQWLDYKKGDVVIEELSVVTPLQVEIWRQIVERTQTDSAWLEFLVIWLFTAILIGITFGLLFLMQRQTPETRDATFVALVLILTFVALRLFLFIADAVADRVVSLPPSVFLFGAPVAAGAMLISYLLSRSTAVAFAIMVGILSAEMIGEDLAFGFCASAIVGGIAGALLIQSVRQRLEIFKVGLQLAAIQVLLLLGLTLIGSGFEPLAGKSFIYTAGMTLFGHAVLAPLLVSVPIYETLFGYLTDIKLLELSNFNHPLLRELIVQAPGTYHHSYMVGTLAEESAKTVGANSLFVRIASYYHDIGKIRMPEYFIENQTHGENRHDKLAPSMSALILISHVKEGVELAKQHRLPQEFIDIIQQHHGTSLISYFYHRALDQGRVEGKTIVESDYRYPGPRPQSKEAGIVMIADTIEAAARSLDEPTPARIQGLVQRLINKHFADGQFNECELTLKDLNEIAKSITKNLSSFYHQRVDYPHLAADGAAKKRRKEREKQSYIDEDRNKKSGKSRPSVDGTNPENGQENLRRLGIS